MFQEWLKKYYPIPAKECTEGRELHHSLRKWCGLRRRVLNKYSLKIHEGDLYVFFDSFSPETCVLNLDYESCACCLRALKNEFEASENNVLSMNSHCSYCDIFKSRSKPCDKSIQHENISPFAEWVKYHDPEPMIRVLKKAICWKRNNEKIFADTKSN